MESPHAPAVQSAGVIKNPEPPIAPVNPNADWQMKGYSGGGNAGYSYTYFNPNNTGSAQYKTTNQPMEGAETFDQYNKDRNITPYKPIQPPKQPGLNQWNNLAELKEDPAANGIPNRDILSGVKTPEMGAKAIQSDPMANSVLPRLDPKITGGEEQNPETLLREMHLNLDQNPQLKQWAEGLTSKLHDSGTLNSPDQGMQEQGLRDLLTQIQELSRQNPEAAAQFYKQIFGQHSAPSTNINQAWE
jgi:hypothetical protein